MILIFDENNPNRSRLKNVFNQTRTLERLEKEGTVRRYRQDEKSERLNNIKNAETPVTLLENAFVERKVFTSSLLLELESYHIVGVSQKRYP